MSIETCGDPDCLKRMPREYPDRWVAEGVDYPLDLAYGLQGFRGMRNGCSVSGGLFLKALEHEYIDRRMSTEVLFFIECCKAIPPKRGTCSIWDCTERCLIL